MSMKCRFCIFALLISFGSATKLRKIIVSGSGDQQSKDSKSALTTDLNHFGHPDCPCVGMSNVEGHVDVNLGDSVTTSYPADAFTSCKAWDDGENLNHCMNSSQTPGKGKGWCAQSWCFVDPCNCKIPTAPKKVLEDGYFPGGKYQGKPLYYSYATCGSVDVWASKEKQKELAREPKVCSAKVDTKKWGHNKCKCIGIDGQPGTTNMSLSASKTAPYESDAGATCGAWDADVHPSCKSNNGVLSDKTGAPIPGWCKKTWCFVDPCSCNIGVPAKPSTYLPAATFQGRPLHYSYATCGDIDEFSATGNAGACAMKRTAEDCHTVLNEGVGTLACRWTGDVCMQVDLAKACFAHNLPPLPKEEQRLPVIGQGSGVLAASKPKPEPPKPPTFEEFKPTCVNHMRKLFVRIERHYTHAQLEQALLFECDLDAKFPETRDEMFKDQRNCNHFTHECAAARHAELKGATDPYHNACKLWYHNLYGPPPLKEKRSDWLLYGLLFMGALCAVIILAFR
eukprot:TRINITY_DN16752_c0_g3_i1.p1 TRINITY_DN16752_c0_g3~~TRINITY_DN16752_c0_g3_i1.p1  ORF type:complete len:510 (+),score=92.93 TRINITY_DN16752_c0_g3_i1:93-1622(+)